MIGNIIFILIGLGILYSSRLFYLAEEENIGTLSVLCKIACSATIIIGILILGIGFGLLGEIK